MRHITNHAGLPGPMYTALASDTYKGSGDISVTRLITPPRIVTLTKFHEDQIEEDAADRIWSLLGSSVHRMLELSASEDVTVETRLSMPIQGLDIDSGPWVWKVSGQPDLYMKNEATICEWKVTSVWTILFGGRKEWEPQVNLQAMLHRHKGDLVNEAYVYAVLRDWQMRKAKYEKDYPPTAVMKIAIPLWDQEQCIAYAKERVKLHQQAQLSYHTSGRMVNFLPLCTPEERWQHESRVAVKRQDNKGKVNKKADRVFDTEAEAKKYIFDNIPNLKGKSFAPLEFRPGENVRCESYCSVNKFCDFYLNLVKQREDKIFETEELDPGDRSGAFRND